MKLAIIGYGKMGTATARIAKDRQHEVVRCHGRDFTVDLAREADAAIHCSVAEAVQRNTEICAQAKTNLVVVTTGWYDNLDWMEKMAAKSGIGVLWSSNFSVGMNVFFRLVEYAAQLANRFDEYDVWAAEHHHRYKADSPSGSAKTLGRILLANLERKSSIVEDRLNRRREDDEIHFSSVRGGEANFRHEVGFESAADSIRLVHAAHNRDGYALGAVKGAEWLRGRQGFFGVEDFLKTLTGEQSE